MTIDQLRKAYNREPFQPFEIYLADGRVVPIRHRDFLYIPPKAERTFGVADDTDSIETFDLLLVVSLKPMNGRAKRGRRDAA